MFLLSAAKKIIGGGRKRKKSRGNPGNPGLRKKKRTLNVKRLGSKAASSADVSAIAGLTSNNPALSNTLQKATGSTSKTDWAAYFKSITPQEREALVNDTRSDAAAAETPAPTDNKLDRALDTVTKVATAGAGVYKLIKGANGGGDGSEEAEISKEDEKAKAKKQTTMYVIIAVVIIVILVVLVLLLRTKKQYV